MLKKEGILHAGGKTRGPLLFSYSFKECYSLPILTTCLAAFNIPREAINMQEKNTIQDNTKGFCVAWEMELIFIIRLERKSRFLVNSWSSDSFVS